MVLCRWLRGLLSHFNLIFCISSEYRGICVGITAPCTDIWMPETPYRTKVIPVISNLYRGLRFSYAILRIHIRARKSRDKQFTLFCAGQTISLLYSSDFFNLIYVICDGETGDTATCSLVGKTASFEQAINLQTSGQRGCSTYNMLAVV